MTEWEERVLTIMRREPTKWWWSIEVHDKLAEDHPKVNNSFARSYAVDALISLESDGFLERRRETDEEQGVRIRATEGQRGVRKRSYFRVTGKARKHVFPTSEAGKNLLGGLVPGTN
jgi:hypothetical protein